MLALGPRPCHECEHSTLEPRTHGLPTDAPAYRCTRHLRSGSALVQERLAALVPDRRPPDSRPAARDAQSSNARAATGAPPATGCRRCRPRDLVVAGCVSGITPVSVHVMCGGARRWRLASRSRTGPADILPGIGGVPGRVGPVDAIRRKIRFEVRLPAQRDRSIFAADHDASRGRGGTTSGRYTGGLDRLSGLRLCAAVDRPPSDRGTGSCSAPSSASTNARRSA